MVAVTRRRIGTSGVGTERCYAPLEVTAILQGVAFPAHASRCAREAARSRNTVGTLCGNRRDRRTYARNVRTIDLAVYADVLAGKAATLAARLERARDALRQAAIEREVRVAFDPATVQQLERVGVVSAIDVAAQRAEVTALARDLRAVEELQAWVEARLFEAREADGQAVGTTRPE